MLHVLSTLLVMTLKLSQKKAEEELGIKVITVSCEGYSLTTQ